MDYVEALRFLIKELEIYKNAYNPELNKAVEFLVGRAEEEADYVSYMEENE